MIFFILSNERFFSLYLIVFYRKRLISSNYFYGFRLKNRPFWSNRARSNWSKALTLIYIYILFFFKWVLQGKFIFNSSAAIINTSQRKGQEKLTKNRKLRLFHLQKYSNNLNSMKNSSPGYCSFDRCFVLRFGKNI